MDSQDAITHTTQGSPAVSHTRRDILVSGALFCIIIPGYLALALVCQSIAVLSHETHRTFEPMLVTDSITSCLCIMALCNAPLLTRHTVVTPERLIQPRPDINRTLVWFVALPVLYIGTQVLASIIAWLGKSAGLSHPLPPTHPAPLVETVLFVALIAPITEELLIRGVALRLLTTSVGFWPAVVLSSLTFGWLHGNIAQCVVGVCLGIACCLADRTRNGALWPGILLHIGFNVMTFMNV